MLLSQQFLSNEFLDQVDYRRLLRGGWGGQGGRGVAEAIPPVTLATPALILTTPSQMEPPPKKTMKIQVPATWRPPGHPTAAA